MVVTALYRLDLYENLYLGLHHRLREIVGDLAAWGCRQQRTISPWRRAHASPKLSRMGSQCCDLQELSDGQC